MKTTTRVWTGFLLATLALPRCSCEGEGQINVAPVEMDLSFVEVDPCSNAAIARRIPDDYEDRGQPLTTDLGSRADRVFEIRSVGTVPLKVLEVSLSEADDEYSLAFTDANDAPVTLPIDLAANTNTSRPADLIVRVSYLAADSMPDAVNLIIKTNDPNREEVTFGLTAGRGRLAFCTDPSCAQTSPDAAITFGNVSRGMTGEQTLVIKNDGDGDLDLRDLRLESDSAEFCAPEATALPEGVDGCAMVNLCKVLRPGETYTIHVRYAPVDGGQDTGVIKVVSGDAGRGTVEVPINGVGAGPAICACLVEGANCTPTASIDFGAVGVGASERRVVRLQSCGTEAAEITEADLEMGVNNPFRTGPEFTLVRGFAAGMVEPGMFVEGEIQYSPTAAGEHRGGLRFTQAPMARSWIALIGRAATCDLAALPQLVSFGTVAGGQSADRNVILVNNGAQECTVTAITDPANGFSIVNKPPTPFTVAPGLSRDLVVRYTAPARQTPQGDMSSFDVTSDEPAPGATNTVQLVAEGGGTPVCSLDVQPNGNALIPSRTGELNFGATNIGYTKTLAVRVANIGNTDCVLQSFNLTTTAGSQLRVTPSSAVPMVIGPGSTGTLDVTFAPTGPATSPLGFYGSLTNYLDFTMAGAGLVMTNYSIGIIARPTVPTIDVIPDAIDFGLVTWQNPRPPDNRSSCGSEARTVRVYNSGTGNLDVTEIRIDGTSDPVFLVTRVTQGANTLSPPYAMTIPPGSFAEIEVRFYPTRIQPALHSGLLVIANNVTTESTVPLRGEGTANSQQTDIFTQLTDNKIDILWVVDDSGSMSEEQNLLATNFAGFIGYADSLSVDYQVAVTTTEINDAPAGKIWACNGFPKIIRPSDANRIQAFECAANVTSPPSGNRRPNPMGSDEAEAGLQAARLALDAPVRDMENAGFLRADARLAVIIVSDEEDQSPGPISLYVDFFRNIKGFRNPQLTSVSAIAGDVPNGCATAAAGQRYADAVGQLGGQFESICSASWATMLQNIGLGVFALRQAWTLSRPADPATIVVRVNGTVVSQGATNGWIFDQGGNAVIFNGSSIPPAGARIEIQYGAICIP